MLLFTIPQLFRRATAMVILVQAAWTMAAEGVRADDFAAGHQETPEMRKLVNEWLDDKLLGIR